MTTPNLSPDQIAALKAEFDLIDGNGDGRVSREEIAVLLQREAYAYLGEEGRKRVLDAHASVDADGDGALVFDEFVVLMTGGPDPQATFRQMFEGYDLDGDGFLTVDDFKRITAQQGGELSTEQAEAMIQQADTNGDGRVSFDEFIAIMNQA